MWLLNYTVYFRVSIDTIQKVLKQMDSSIKNLEMDLKNAQRAPSEPDDKLEFPCWLKIIS